MTSLEKKLYFPYAQVFYLGRLQSRNCSEIDRYCFSSFSRVLAHLVNVLLLACAREA